ncbi:unnamed protein product [Effrenium voratum]|uniref:Uncharacterized protein n=1 Tax=Effrenium voratum TaxID=2562239 RepID=A0AA36JIZ9_9DINO|nr:unnamed protein product [Effrenium voratum]
MPPADLSIQGTPLRPKAGKSAGYGIRESQAERPMQAEKPQPEEVVPQQQLPQPAQKPADKPAAKAVPQQQLPQPAEKPTDKVVPQQQLPKPAEKPAENPAAKAIPQQQLPQPAEKPAEKVPQLPTTEKPAEPAAQMLPEKPPEKHPEPEQVRQALGVVRMVDELDEEEDPLDRFVYTDPAAQEKRKQDRSKAHAANEPSEEDEEARTVSFDPFAKAKDGDKPKEEVRKATGYVGLSDMPPADEEDDEEARTVSFDPFAKAKDGDKPKEEVRKATGYVGLSDMPPADEEEDEEERTVSFDPSAKAKDGDEPKEQVRKATGYVSLSDMPDDEEEEERNVSFDPSAKAKDGDKPKEQVRKSTGYVSLADMPPDEDDYEDNFEEEEEDAKPEAGEKAVSFDQATKDKEQRARARDICTKQTCRACWRMRRMRRRPPKEWPLMPQRRAKKALESRRLHSARGLDSSQRRSWQTCRQKTRRKTVQTAQLPTKRRLRTTTKCPLILPRRRAKTALTSCRLHSARGLDSSQRRIWQTCHQTMRRKTVPTAQLPTKQRLRTTTKCPLILPRRKAKTALTSRRLHSARGLDSSQRRIWQTCHQTMRRKTVRTAQLPTKRRLRTTTKCPLILPRRKAKTALTSRRLHSARGLDSSQRRIWQTCHQTMRRKPVRTAQLPTKRRLRTTTKCPLILPRRKAKTALTSRRLHSARGLDSSQRRIWQTCRQMRRRKTVQTAQPPTKRRLRTTTRCPLILPRRRSKTALTSRRLHSARGLDSSQRRIWQTCHQTMRRQTVQTAQPPTKRRQLRRCLLRRRKRRSCHVIAEVQQTRRQPGRAPDSFEQMRCQRLRKITTTTTTLRRSSKMTSRRTRKVEAHEGRRGTSSGAGQWLSAEVTA